MNIGRDKNVDNQLYNQDPLYVPFDNKKLKSNEFSTLNIENKK